MADLKIVKAATAPATTGAVANSAMPKVAPSKFDAIRSQIAEKVASDVKLPPMAQPTPQQVNSMQNTLTKRLERTDARSANEFFRVEMKNTRLGMEKLTQSVEGLPKQSAFTPIRERLSVMDTQFKKSAGLIHGIKDMDPKSLLNVQMQLYQLSENMELLTKVVEQVNSGVKTIMQTQV